MKTMNEFLKENQIEEDAPVVVSGGAGSVGTPEGLENRVVVKNKNKFKGMLLNLRRKINKGK